MCPIWKLIYHAEFVNCFLLLIDLQTNILDVKEHALLQLTQNT